ncbi:hypothetical protein PM082_017727 [Marasmius tenuissimus]|nr:hypothetical protein PM082_017727 [Marasmius tenuissimus]
MSHIMSPNESHMELEKLQTFSMPKDDVKELSKIITNRQGGEAGVLVNQDCVAKCFH